MPEICLMTKVWRSGSAWVATLTAQAIAEQGVSIAFVAPRSEPASREPVHRNLLRVTTHRELISGEPRLTRALASLRRIWGSIGSVISLRRTTRNFIFSIPEPLLFTLPLFVFLRVSGARVVLIAHDSEPHAWNFSGLMRRVERWAHAMSYQLSSSVVVLAPTVMDSLITDFNVAKQKISVIPHGPFSVGNAGEVPGSHTVLLFGSLRRNKSVLDVIEGVILARESGLDIKLVLAGQPLKQEPGYWEECQAAISKDPSGFDLRIGFLPDEGIPDLIREVDAFILAYSNFSSQSGVGVMASLARRPVIGSRSGGLGILFDQGMVGEILDETISAEGIAFALRSFYSLDATEWATRANSGAASIAKSLRWDAIADQYIKLCRS